MRIERVQNGYVASLSSNDFGGCSRAQVAKTPEELAALVAEWAEGIECEEIEVKRILELKEGEAKKYTAHCLASRKKKLQEELKDLSE